MSEFIVAALYRFVSLPDFEDFQKPLLNFMLERHIRGTLLLASEGINGTVAGEENHINDLICYLRNDERFADLDAKFSYTDELPFYRSRVKLKKEIVTMGVEDIDPVHSAGTYVDPKDWNDLISDENVIVIDTRNDYESAIGTFDNAVIPHTKSFRDFPQFVNDNLDAKRSPKVAMFCTGGIRCEKSTAYLKQQGFDSVYHLKGGILKYLEEVPQESSLWKGECFVFDNRVSVNHMLEKGSYDQCHACRLPISEEEKQHPHYRSGVSCPHCFNDKSDHERQRFVEREKQMRLAQQRGEEHIGQDMTLLAKQKHLIKVQKKNKQRGG